MYGSILYHLSAIALFLFALLWPVIDLPFSRGRERYVNEEFDLDLTYITERIIAMSFPATGMESTYRNSLKDVAKMLKTKHQENYMVNEFNQSTLTILLPFLLPWSSISVQCISVGVPSMEAPFSWVVCWVLLNSLVVQYLPSCYCALWW